MDAVGSDSPAAVGPAADLPDPAEHDWCAYPGIPGPGTRAGRLVRGLAGSCAVGGRGGRRRAPPSPLGSPPRGTPLERRDAVRRQGRRGRSVVPDTRATGPDHRLEAARNGRRRDRWSGRWSPPA